MAVYQALLLARRIPSLVSAGALPSFLRNRARTATIIATGGHFASSVVDALVRSVHPRLYGFNRTFSLMEPIPGLVEALNDFQPAVLGSYATALAVLAGEQEAERLRIDPALVLSGAERLSPPLRERISASFRCPVRDTYAASEFMGIAFDCRHGRLHVNADWVILEPVDAEGGPVPPGETSHTTLLTNLANRLQPLIRYDLGDSVTMLPGPCRCGSPLPGIRPEGRRDEILRVEAADGTSRPLLPLVLATVLEETPGILRYQLVQSGPRSLKLRVEEAPGHDRAAVRADGPAPPPGVPFLPGARFGIGGAGRRNAPEGRPVRAESRASSLVGDLHHLFGRLEPVPRQRGDDGAGPQGGVRQERRHREGGGRLHVDAPSAPAAAAPPPLPRRPTATTSPPVRRTMSMISIPRTGAEIATPSAIVSPSATAGMESSPSRNISNSGAQFAAWTAMCRGILSILPASNSSRNPM